MPSPSPLIRPVGFGLAVAFALVAVVLPFLPESMRLWNYSAFGAVALFAAARAGRLGLPLGIALALGGKLAFDMVRYVQQDYHSDYEPSETVYACLAVYGVLGWLLCRNSTNPLRAGAATLASSAIFFLVTNFVSWQRFDLPYNPGISGLFESYWMGLPFWRGTLMSDVLFTAVLFGLDAVAVLAVRSNPVANESVPIRSEQS